MESVNVPSTVLNYQYLKYIYQVVVVVHILRRIDCQPERTTLLHGGQSRYYSEEHHCQWHRMAVEEDSRAGLLRGYVQIIKAH